MKRLDKLVSEMFPQIGRSKARELCLAGEVLVSGRPRQPGFLVRANSNIELLSQPEKVILKPELVQRAGGPQKFIEVVFEDADILIVEKPRCMHSLRQTSEDDICLADCLMAHDKSLEGVSGNSLEAGLVNRLDFYTGGMAVAAKNKKSWDELHQHFLESQTEKTYIALVEGKAKSGLIDIPIELRKGRKTVRANSARNLSEAKTEIVSVDSELSLKNCSLVRAKARHLVRHQIRAHLAEVGHPLVGDELYGSTSELPDEGRLDKDKIIREGFFLYCSELSLRHPKDGKRVLFTSSKEVVF